MSPQSIINETDCDLLVVAGGYEERARFVPEGVPIPRRGVVGIKYLHGPSDNLKGDAVLARLRKRCEEDGKFFVEIPYSVTASIEFEVACKRGIGQMRELSIESVAIDISGMPQYVIMQILASVRETWPNATTEILYVAAKEYPPSEEQIHNFIKQRNQAGENDIVAGLDYEPAEPLCPNQFAGVGQRRGASVMVLFAGYERNRSHAAYDSVNPSKLVLIHSLPRVACATDRLAYSKAVHLDLGGDVDKSIETLDNLDVAGHMDLLTEYYNYLYDQYDMVLVPVHSKMQTLACYLFWEMYSDVQVVFPIPIRYRVSAGGMGLGDCYRAKLPPRPGFNYFHK